VPRGGGLLGYSWLPGKRDSRIAGTLSIYENNSENNSVRLNLVGSFKGIDRLNRPDEYPVVPGITMSGAVHPLSTAAELHWNSHQWDYSVRHCGLL